MKKYLLSFAFVYTVFVIYGSLVPLEYKSLSLNVAWEKFLSAPYLTLGIHSRADWVSNGLLFIPFSFLWLGAFWHKNKKIKQLALSFFIGLICILLSLSIEFTQVFFPQRTVSINDPIAESIGGFIGILLWWHFHPQFCSWLKKWRESYNDATQWKIYLHLYLFFLFFYNIMPLDLTINPTDLYLKWKEDRIILIPFSGLKGDTLTIIYEILSDIIIWIPVPLLWLKDKTLNFINIISRVVFIALTIEFFQLFIFSRISDITDIIMALLGSILGILLARYTSRHSAINKDINTNSTQYFSSTFYFGIILYLVWNGILILALWYPFDFNFDKVMINTKASKFFSVPFYNYYYTSEYYALTQLLRKIIFFIPLGIALSLIVSKDRNNLSFFLKVLLITLCAGNTFLLEIVQVFLNNKYSDITDWLLELSGCGLGFWLGMRIYSLLKTPEATESMQTKILSNDLNKQIKIPHSSPKQLINNQWLHIFISLLFSTLILNILINQPSVPYNAKELIAGDMALLKTLGFAVVLTWCFGFPAWSLANIKDSLSPPAFYFTKNILIHSFISWLLVRALLPIESIYDIVGAPILNIHPEIELLIRFMALFSLFSGLLFGSGLLTLSFIKRRKLLIYHINYFLLLFFIILPFSYWGVIIEAATDNLTELMSNNGDSFSVIAIAVYIYLLSLSADFLSSFTIKPSYKYVIICLVVILISFPAGYQLLDWGTESMILKYNQVFSALQFLLSPDRENLISPEDIKNHFYIAHFTLIFILTYIRMPIYFSQRIKNKHLR